MPAVPRMYRCAHLHVALATQNVLSVSLSANSNATLEHNSAICGLCAIIMSCDPQCLTTIHTTCIDLITNIRKYQVVVAL